MDRSTMAAVAAMITSGGHKVSVAQNSDCLVGPDVVHDSRTATPGSLFVALSGDNVDGHQFVADAKRRGAAAAIVSRQLDIDIAQLVTNDPLAALTALARAQVAIGKDRGLQVIAVTGSSGKTSTKDLLAQVLAADGPTISPVGSFNNELGTPLTACRIDESTKYLVAEMGARAVGDVAYLCSIVNPSVGMVINIGTAHIGEFGSQEAIAKAKGEMIEHLDPTGWAVLNADDPLVDAMSSRTSARIAKFAVNPTARPDCELFVAAENLEPDDFDRFGFDLCVWTPEADSSGLEPARAQDSRAQDSWSQERASVQRCRVQLQSLGAHQVGNAAAAACAALAVGVPLERVANGLSNAQSSSPMRMQLHELNQGAAVINDAYNANPDSMAAGLRTLAAIGRRRKARMGMGCTIAVIGEMLELGQESAEIHQRIGELAGELGIDRVIAVGERADDIVAGAKRAGAYGETCSIEETAASLELLPGDVVLVKASRALALERVANRLVERGVGQ